MAESAFHQPIHLVRDAGELRIASAHDAYAALTGNWPEARGKWYHAATRACRSAASGDTSPHIARRMFLYAATEAQLAAR